MWNQIHQEIVSASRAIAEAGKYDDAIFAAFRLVEATIQERIGSKQIGEGLVIEAFEGTPPRVNISNDTRDQRGIRDLFSGALGNIRNDRGHKKTPITPCESLDDCILYLGFASFLLYLLAKDTNTFPRIDSVRVLGTAEEPRLSLAKIDASEYGDGGGTVLYKRTSTSRVELDGRTSIPRSLSSGMASSYRRNWEGCVPSAK